MVLAVALRLSPLAGRARNLRIAQIPGEGELPRVPLSARLRNGAYRSAAKSSNRGNDHGESRPPDGGRNLRACRSFAGNSGGVVVRLLGRDARPDAGAAVSGLARRLTKAAG